LSAGLVKKMS